jgi:hypothetical protein
VPASEQEAVKHSNSNRKPAFATQTQILPQAPKPGLLVESAPSLLSFTAKQTAAVVVTKPQQATQRGEHRARPSRRTFLQSAHQQPQSPSTIRHPPVDITEPPRCLSQSAIRRWTPSPLRKYLLPRNTLFFEPHPRTHAHTCLPHHTSQPPPPPTMDVPNSNHPVTSTPQNTPANAAPISSHAQKPGVGTIKEGKSQSRFACPSNPASRRKGPGR